MLPWLRRRSVAPVPDEVKSLAEPEVVIPEPVEAKSLTAPPDKDWIILSGGTRPGTFAVSTADALKVPAVAAAVRVIAEGVAALDRRIVRVEDGREVDAPEHPIARLLRDEWNDWASPFEGVRDLITAALCKDFGGLGWINRVDGEVREIIPYQTLAVQFDADTSEPTYRLGGRIIPASEVIHIRGPYDRCPMTLARETIGVAAIMADRAGKLFKNAARPGGWIGFKEDLDKEAFDLMKQSWEDTHAAPEGSGKTAILYNGAEYHAVQFNSVDSQFLELKKEQIVEIGRAFGVPPGMLYEMDRQTWANMEQASKEWLVNTLEAWCQVTEAALSRSLLTPAERRNHRIVIDRDDLTRADIGARATAYSQLIASRVINPNQARKWEGLDPYPEGNEYMNPHITTATKTTGPARHDPPEEPA